MEMPQASANGKTPQPGTDAVPGGHAASTRRRLPLVVEDRTYMLTESMNAYCAMEAMTGTTTSALVIEAAGGGMRATRALLWAHLQFHHGAEFATVEQAGALVDAVGLDVVWQQLQFLGGVDTPAPAPPVSRQVRRARVRKAPRGG